MSARSLKHTRHDLCAHAVAPDVDGGAGHVEEAVDADDDADGAERNLFYASAFEAGVDCGDNDDERDESSAWDSCGADCCERCGEDCDDEVGGGEIDAAELEEEECGDRFVECSAVEVERCAEWDDEVGCLR